MRAVCRSWRNVSWRKIRLLASTVAAVSLAGSLFATSSTETAVANGDTRTLHLYHTHTGESIDATFRVDGHYDYAVLKQLNHFLRDWRNNDEINMDPRLFDTLWEVYRTAGATEPIQIYSAYRSPETNAMLRRRSRAVAEHSQHMLGKAMDTTIPGFPMHRIREIGMKLQRGGVGWYPSSNFVHLDVGSVRSWPRMSYDQLAGLFPDGKTVHIASNGQVLPGYEQARAEIAAHGGTEVPPAQESQGFFAWLFGGGGSADGGDEEDRRATAVAAAPAIAAPAPAAQPARQQPFRTAAMAYAAADATPTPTPPALDADQIGASAAVPAGATAATVSAAESNTGTDTEDAVLPLPPRRPVDLVAEVDIPLPPIRPDGLSRVQQGSVHFAEATGGAHKTLLPAIITQGGRQTAALAYADSAHDSLSAHIAPMPPVRPASIKAVGLRAAFRGTLTGQPAAPTSVVASSTPSPVAAPRGVTGLRRAARLMATQESL